MQKIKVIIYLKKKIKLKCSKLQYLIKKLANDKKLNIVISLNNCRYLKKKYSCTHISRRKEMKSFTNKSNQN